MQPVQPYCRKLPSHSEVLEVRRRTSGTITKLYTRDCQIKRLDTPYCINCKTYGHTANYSKCPLFPKPRKGTDLKTNYTNTVNSIVRPNTSYAQIAKNTLHSANPQQMAPPDTNTANISQHSALEITPPAHIPTATTMLKLNHANTTKHDTGSHTISTIKQLPKCSESPSHY
ncbi:hypothetical protein TNCV_1660901 [Trichonephila clavipes]|nr:hypothetical protein TNCV_1660901 [Trichonephila clavipes]